MNVTVKVHLLGREYALRSGGDAAILQEAAQLVEERIAGLSSVVSVDTRDRQMLATLNLAGDFLQEKRRRLELETELQAAQRARDVAEQQYRQMEATLIARIEESLHS